MYAHKVMCFLAAAIVAAGCVDANKNATSQIEEDLRQELAASKAQHKDLQDQYIQQNQEITNILTELAAVTGKTADLRLDVESGSAKMTQADQISSNIESIKAKISALEKSNSVLSGKNKDFKKMIDGFNQVIEEQEHQISSLRKEIEGKDATIRSQKDTIDTQSKTIVEQNKKLQETVEAQAKMLCDAGETLEAIADNTPQVSWKKNKEKVAAMSQDIYRKAREYYQRSYESGYAPAKEHLAIVNSKIAAE